jgi:hypothetical protein
MCIKTQGSYEPICYGNHWKRIMSRCWQLLSYFFILWIFNNVLLLSQVKMYFQLKSLSPFLWAQKEKFSKWLEK